MYKDLMKPDEDWTNLTNSAERRKIQNCRNMRERTDEVQRLKARIRELEGTQESTSLDAFLDALPSTDSNPLGAFGHDSDLNSEGQCGGGDKRTVYTNTRPPLASSMRSGQDQFQGKGDTPVLSPPFLPSQNPQFVTRAGKPSTALVENDRFLTDNAEQYFSSTQPVTRSIIVDSNVSQKPGSEKQSELSLSPSCGHPSLLHLAVESGNADTLHLLLRDYGMSTTRRHGAGYTPLQRAVLCGRTDLVSIFLEHGNDVAIDDEYAERSKDVDLDDRKLQVSEN
ncbi:hypothetical protein BDV36DRAFT_291437 [Aspergillus pseudocaelatus]|uniref:Ankyrin repeat-containing domain protein n=1 Tax=Aspergillus pseudocaelatus TaxID=1825620 RepID=A0ABQ6X0W3_9EURO|nr:hypothetical protein BDV36DRAFT_291437 [Aspergillus pseudocaelatus]